MVSTEPGRRVKARVERDGERPDSPLVAFEAVYRSLYDRMVCAAHMLTGSNEAAEELVQDAFVQLYARFDSVEEPAGYLYRSVVNGCRASHRRRRVAQRLQPAPPATTMAAPEFDETWTALLRLSDRRRAVIVLRFYADLPLAEIARVMGCRTGTVKSLLHRGLAQLKGEIER